jgi:hypothetical protein
MSARFAKIISTVINPIVLISFVPFVLVHKVSQDFNLAIYWTLISFIFIIIFSIFVLVGIRVGFFSNLDISNRNQRPLLYSFAIILSLIYLSVLFILKAPFILSIGIISLALGLAIGELINTRIKASLHVGTLVAFVTTIVEIYGAHFLIAYALVPLVAWARIKTHNHTMKEILVGCAIGFFLTIAVYLVIEYII